MEELQLSLLGKLQIIKNGHPLTGFVSAKAQALLCYLAVTNRPHDRQTLAALLWGDMPDAEARTSLRTVLANLRKLAGDHLLIDRDTVAFNPNAPYWLDLELFQANLAAAGLSEPPPSPNYQLPITNYQPPPPTFQPSNLPTFQPSNLHPPNSPNSLTFLRQAIELYRGDFLEGFSLRDALDFEDWMLHQRDHLRHLAVQALLTLAKQQTNQAEYATAIDYTSRLLTLEPWREEVHRLMMTLLAKTGQRSAALAQFETCRRHLAQELAVEPSPETQALYDRLRAAEHPRPHNLPPQTTPFIGRDKELAQLGAYLENPNCRLISLVGLGGVGKTRLALQAASANLALFRDGLFLVPLAPVNTFESLVTAIATALNFTLSGPLETKTQLLNHLRPKETLLILDNFEHLLLLQPSTPPTSILNPTAGPRLLVEILQTAPKVKLLLTSRERLRLQEEWVLEIEGLPYPQLPITNYQLPITNYQPPPPTFQPSNLPTFQPSNLPTFQPSNLPTFQPSNLPTF